MTLKDAITLQSRSFTAQIADKLLDEAQINVPVVTGNLKNSAKVTTVSNKKKVEYTAPYAYYVHENANSRGYKWLEKAVIKTVQRVNAEGETIR